MLAPTLAIALLLLAALAAPWQRLRDDGQRNAYAAAICALLVVWQLRITVDGGLVLHLSGAAVLTLIAGPWLAMLGSGLIAAAALATAPGPASLAGWGYEVLGSGVIPVAASWLGLKVLRRFAPAHPFVYIFGNGFFGAGIALAAGGCVTGVLAYGTGVVDAATLHEVWLPAVLLLAFAEAWLSGMVLTLLVVYRPHWLGTFDARRYFTPSGFR